MSQIEAMKTTRRTKESTVVSFNGSLAKGCRAAPPVSRSTVVALWNGI